MRRSCPTAVKEVVATQVEVGLDVVNDGEFSKRGGFQLYAPSRMSGIERRAVRARRRGAASADERAGRDPVPDVLPGNLGCHRRRRWFRTESVLLRRTTQLHRRGDDRGRHRPAKDRSKRT